MRRLRICSATSIVVVASGSTVESRLSTTASTSEDLRTTLRGGSTITAFAGTVYRTWRNNGGELTRSLIRFAVENVSASIHGCLPLYFPLGAAHASGLNSSPSPAASEARASNSPVAGPSHKHASTHDSDLPR